ncbi:hypothetical protein GQ42DRAFT_55855 [Ramicandelaber brevisporus]|nr:hypothetical protein GQ42DRAFT_55855 [Ramicandelaber brevisporus]
MKYYSSLKNRITALEVHTCAQFIGYPFGGAAQLPPQPALNNFKTIATKMANTVAKGGGKEYSVVNLYNDVIPFTGLSIDYFYKPDNSTRAVYSLGFEFRRGDIGDPESAIGCFIYENSDIVKVGKEVIPAFLDLVDFGLANPLA